MLVEQYTHPTAPVELRQAVAVGLGKLWKILQLQVIIIVVEYHCDYNTSYGNCWTRGLVVMAIGDDGLAVKYMCKCPVNIASCRIAITRN